MKCIRIHRAQRSAHVVTRLRPYGARMAMTLAAILAMSLALDAQRAPRWVGTTAAGLRSAARPAAHRPVAVRGASTTLALVTAGPFPGGPSPAMPV